MGRNPSKGAWNWAKTAWGNPSRRAAREMNRKRQGYLEPAEKTPATSGRRVGSWVEMKIDMGKLYAR